MKWHGSEMMPTSVCEDKIISSFENSLYSNTTRCTSTARSQCSYSTRRSLFVTEDSTRTCYALALGTCYFKVLRLDSFVVSSQAFEITLSLGFVLHSCSWFLLRKDARRISLARAALVHPPRVLRGVLTAGVRLLYRVYRGRKIPDFCQNSTPTRFCIVTSRLLVSHPVI